MKKRQFDSYFEEYSLLTSEAEINAYWQRMDEIVAAMSKAEKKEFFEQLQHSIDRSLQDLKAVKAQALAALAKGKQTKQARMPQAQAA